MDWDSITEPSPTFPIVWSGPRWSRCSALRMTLANFRRLGKVQASAYRCTWCRTKGLPRIDGELYRYYRCPNCRVVFTVRQPGMGKRLPPEPGTLIRRSARLLDAT